MPWDANGDAAAGSAGAYFPTVATSFAPNVSSGGFLSKIDHASGQFDYSTYIPGAVPSSVCVDSAGNAYLAGSATVGFPATPGAFQSDAGEPGNYDAFILEMNPAGQQLVFGTLLGGTFGGGALAVALSSDTVVIAGTTESTFFPVTDHSLPFCDLSAAPGLTVDIGEGFVAIGLFVASFDHKGALLNSVAYGDCTGQSATGLAPSASGTIYFTGTNSQGQITFLEELDLQAVQPTQITKITDSAGFQTGPFAPFQLISIFGKGWDLRPP